MSVLNIAIVQQKCVPNSEENLCRSVNGIKHAAKGDAQLVVLSELHRSLYFCQREDVKNFDLSETVPGPTTELLGRLAQELNIVIVASLFEKRAAGVYHNTAVVLDSDGSIAGKYRKMHIPDDPGFYEKFYFTPGDLGFHPIDTSIGKLGVLICWDQWFPEAARLVATAGAEILIYPTAIGWDPRDSKQEQERQHQAWVTIQRSHAIANGLHVVAANRTGHEGDPDSGPGIEFWGSSFVAGPQGEIIFQADTSEEITRCVSLDMSKTENVRKIWPYFRDRRVDAYRDLLKIYRD